MNNIAIEEFPNGVKICQNSDGYKFTKDAVDLAKFCKIKHTDYVLEMCAGSGVVSFYAYAITKFARLYLNEIQDDACDIIRKNIIFNNLCNDAKCLPGNLKDLQLKNFEKKLDVIICNPPYFKKSTQKINVDYKKAISRHELEATLEDIVKKASELIKDKGRFYLVMTISRMSETIYLLEKYGFACKIIKLLTNGKKEAYLAIFEAVYNGKTGVRVIIE